MEKKELLIFNKSAKSHFVVLGIKQDSLFERYYLEIHEFGEDCILAKDANGRTYSFLYETIVSIYEMSPRQFEKFKSIRRASQ